MTAGIAVLISSLVLSRAMFRSRRRRQLGYGLRNVKTMWTFTVVLFIIWVLGLVTGYNGGGLIHILPMLAVAVVLLRFIESRPIRSLDGVKANKSRDGVPQL